MTRYACFSPACPPAGEFLLRTGSIDSRFTGFDRATRAHASTASSKRPQAKATPPKSSSPANGRRQASPSPSKAGPTAIFTDEAGVTVIDEIKTTAVPADDIAEDMNPCHWAQGMVYGALYGRQKGLEKLDVRLTYYQIDTDDILRFVRHFTLEELEAFLQDLLEQYAPWAQRQLAWKEQRGVSFRRWISPFRPTGPGRGRWQAKSTAPALPRRLKAVSGSSVRPPPASARP